MTRRPADDIQEEQIRQWLIALPTSHFNALPRHYQEVIQVKYGLALADGRLQQARAEILTNERMADLLNLSTRHGADLQVERALRFLVWQVARSLQIGGNPLFAAALGSKCMSANLQDPSRR